MMQSVIGMTQQEKITDGIKGKNLEVNSLNIHKRRHSYLRRF